jgi:hypothetical protein
MNHFRQYTTWAIAEHFSHPNDLAERLSVEHGTHMMIGPEEHVIEGIQQVIPISDEQGTSDVVILLKVRPLHPRNK